MFSMPKTFTEMLLVTLCVLTAAAFLHAYFTG